LAQESILRSHSLAKDGKEVSESALRLCNMQDPSDLFSKDVLTCLRRWLVVNSSIRFVVEESHIRQGAFYDSDCRSEQLHLLDMAQLLDIL
jgi:hypothetical protein